MSFIQSARCAPRTSTSSVRSRSILRNDRRQTYGSAFDHYRDRNDPERYLLVVFSIHRVRDEKTPTCPTAAFAEKQMSLLDGPPRFTISISRGPDVRCGGSLMTSATTHRDRGPLRRCPDRHFAVPEGYRC